MTTQGQQDWSLEGDSELQPLNYFTNTSAYNLTSDYE